MHPEAEALLVRLSLAPHPEGGYYRETWRSATRVATPRGARSALTVVDYLLPAGSFSAFHRIRADEVWSHGAGDAIELHTVDPAGRHEVARLGPDDVPGHRSHAVVPAGWWQAARPLGDRYGLASCSVAPGFEFEDLELATPGDLLGLRPDLRDLVRTLARPPG